jgi:hypothetical protein
LSGTDSFYAQDNFSIGDLFVVRGDPWVNKKEGAALVYASNATSENHWEDKTWTVLRGTYGVVLDFGNRGNGAYDDEVFALFTTGISGWIEISTIENVSRT